MKILLPLIKKTGFVFLWTFLLVFAQKSFGQTTIYSQNFGSGSIFPTGWSASGSPTWTISNSSSSTGYAGASGNSNAEFVNSSSGTSTLTFSNSLSTVGYSGVTVIWGGRRNTTGAPTVTFQWSIDGTTWNSPTFTDVAINNGNWSLVNNGTPITLPAAAAGAANLRLRWSCTSTSNSNSLSYRFDDLIVAGTAIVPSLTTSSSTLTFPNTVSGNVSATQTFTVSGTNLTGYPGNITVAAPTGFLVYNGSAWVSSYTIPYTTNTLTATTVSVEFVPTTNTVSSGSISITGGGDATPPSVAVSGTGTASAASDVSANSTYVYTAPVPYINFQTASGLTTANSVGVMGLILRDGGSTLTDADNLSTTLTAISFTTGGSTAIRTAALFNGATKLAEVVVNGATTIPFSGLAIAATDNSSQNFELRVTYQSTVTDNQQIQFAVSAVSANASGSAFAAANGGAAVSSVAGSNNKIAVTASKLIFGQSPSNVLAGSVMSPSVILKAVDANNNIDVDYVSTTSLTSTATFAGTATTSIAAVSGTATFNNLIFSVPGTGFTLAASSGSLTASGNSSAFNVTTSQTSDIALTSGYVYTAPVLYANYQTASGLTSANSVGAMGLNLRDGGSTLNDADNLPTTLTGITFTVSGAASADIRTAALFVAGVKVSEVLVNGSTTISFSSLNIVAADNSNQNFELRVTYVSSVTDNTQMAFTVSSVTANSTGSGFAATNGGAAVSLTAGSDNKISVVASQLVFSQQPTNTTVGTVMTPAVVLKAVDANNNVDADYVSTVSLSTTGVFTASSTTNVAASAGVATFSNLVFNTQVSNINVSSSAFGGVTSNAFSVGAFASLGTDNYKTQTTGDWSIASIWMSSHNNIDFYTATSAPASSAAAINIQNTLTANGSVSSSNLIINNVLNVNGTLTNTGTISGASATSLLFNSGSTYMHALNGGVIPTAAWNINSTCNVSGVTSTAPTGLGQSFGNFTWSSSLSSEVNLNSTLKTVNGNFTFNSPSASGKALDLAGNNSLTLNIGGSFLMQNTGDLVLTNGNSSPVINVAGTLSLSSGGTLDFGSGFGTGIINLKGNFSESGGTDRKQSGLGANGVINFAGTNQSITSSGSGSANVSNVDFNINSGSTVTLLSGFPIDNGNQIFAISSTFTVLNGGTLICGNNTITGIVKSSFFGTNSTFTIAAGGSIQMGSTAGITVSGTSSGNIQTATRNYDAGANYTYNGTSAQVTGSGLPATLNGNLSIENSAGVTFTSTSQVVNGTLNIAAGSTLTMPTAASTTTLAGVINANSTGVINAGTSSTLLISGSSAISSPIAFGTGTFTAFTLNRTGSLLTLASDLKTTTLSLTNGKIDVNNSVLSASTINGASSTNYVVTGNGSLGTGYLQLNNLTAGTLYTLPIGTLNYYLPVNVNPASSSINWKAKVFSPVTTNGAFDGSPYTGVALQSIVNAVWDIVPSTNPTTATITLNWVDQLEGSIFSGYTDNYIGISHYTSGAWQGATANGGASNSTDFVTSTFTSFSPFGIGSINNPLPVVLVDFNAVLNSSKTVDVSWTTQQEVNSSHFDVERSADGIVWKTIGTVEAKGNSALPSNYTFVDDAPLKGANYYRLKMVNINDAFGFTTVKVVRTLQVAGINIFPNPARNYVNVSVSQPATDLNIRLISQSGQVMQIAKINAGSGSTTTLQVNDYPQGTYILQITAADGTQQTSKVVIMR